MTDFDKILLAVIGVGAVIGMWRGFFREAVSTFGLVLAAIAANCFQPYLQPYTSSWFSSERTAGIVAWVVTFLLSMIVLGWIARLLDKLFESASLEWTVRLAGAALGAVKVALLGGFLITAIQMLSSIFPFMSLQPYIGHSQIAPILQDVVQFIIPWVTEHIPD